MVVCRLKYLGFQYYHEWNSGSTYVRQVWRGQRGYRSWIVKRYGKYRRKASWIAKRYGKCGRKVGWIVKWYGKYGRKASWKVKRYGKYRRKLWKDMKNMEEK